MTVLFPQLKYLTCLKKPYANRQINLLTFCLAKLPFGVALCCEHWHSKSFSFSKWNRREDRVVGETVPGKPHKNMQNTLTSKALQHLPSLLYFCRSNSDAWKEQPVQSNRHFQRRILVSLSGIKICGFVWSTFMISLSKCFKWIFFFH